jgi:tetratricopeptide (TPR) repeat protein
MGKKAVYSKWRNLTKRNRYIDLNKANKNNLADGYVNRGLAYHYLGNFDKAVADFSSAIGLDPSMKNAYTNRATSYRKLNKIAKATADESKAAELQP